VFVLEEILELLETNSKYTDDQLAALTGRTVGEVRQAIAELEEDKIIAGYTALVNWERTGREIVTALIEVKVTPQRGEGFDKVAERIYSYPKVKACYLMSGGFDLTVIVEGKSMKEVALFVAEKLAPLDHVLSTSTHFVLKKYKDKGAVFGEITRDDREAVIL
jgi:DNA-binding Lrp family transcriptional regulator